MRYGLLLTAVLVLATGCVVQGPPAPEATPQAVVSAPDGAGHRPVRVRIAAIGVDSPLAELGTDSGGALVPPGSAAIAGWYAAGPAPGDRGPALLAGHVDSRSGPGVFFRLRELRPGDLVDVTRADTSTVAFAVTRVSRDPKSAFPTDLVYAPTPGPELRLVTCGGTFDRSARSYLDNVVVEGVPAGDGGWDVTSS